jgi:hypothetical protein
MDSEEDLVRLLPWGQDANKQIAAAAAIPMRILGFMRENIAPACHLIVKIE